MPYKDISDLPKAQTDQYDEHQKEAFLKAFNNAYEQYGHDESRAFAVAHHAAKQAGKKEGDADVRATRRLPSCRPVWPRDERRRMRGSHHAHTAHRHY